ncbi:MAG TPA: hypothetical protein VGY99_17830 [Candidatus Binataceae bacterium]|nr:hypothetical protein [Candidatus Binataceae bacterium]
MSTLAYSSLTAFLAHRRVLRAAGSRSPDQAGRLAEMEALIAQLSPAERDSLEGADAAGEQARHRQRAERHLIQILRHQGVLSG